MESSVASEIQKLFDAVKQPESPNVISVDNFRNDVIEYLEFIDEEIEDDPDLAEDNHWNLVMNDGELNFDGFFAVMIIRDDGLEVLAGTGKSNDVRNIAESHSMVQVKKVSAALNAACTCKNLQIARGDAEKWLGRSLRQKE